MTKLDEFRSWLYSHQDDCFVHASGQSQEAWYDAIEEVIEKFEAQFADELKAEDEVVEES